MEHYFTNNNELVSNIITLTYQYNSFHFTFLSDNGVFSKKRIDYGSKLLLETYLNEVTMEEKVLDVGCGYGFIGSAISRVNGSVVDMVDVNKRALHLAKRNTKNTSYKGDIFLSDAYQNVKDKYDTVITNPPIRTGKNKVLEILLGAFEHLNDNGKLYFVIRKDQGALSIKKIIEEKYSIQMINRSKGYIVYKVNNNKNI